MTDIEKREPALLAGVAPEELEKAALTVAGFDKVDRATALVAMQVANQYGLEPAMKHLVPIKGNIYITRDGLLHVAHRSGQLDGIVVEATGKEEDRAEWWATVTIHRKDMSHGFTFTGRYSGQNKSYGQEMAIKTATMIGLRHAFDVSIPVKEEMEAIEEEREIIAVEAVQIEAPPAADPIQPSLLADDEELPPEGITPPQLKKLAILLNESEVDDDIWRKHMEKEYGCTSRKDLTKDQATEMIDRLEARRIASQEAE